MERERQSKQGIRHSEREMSYPVEWERQSKPDILYPPPGNRYFGQKLYDLAGEDRSGVNWHLH